jgi:hypothetical protein
MHLPARAHWRSSSFDNACDNGQPGSRNQLARTIAAPNAGFGKEPEAAAAEFFYDLGEPEDEGFARKWVS